MGKLVRNRCWCHFNLQKVLAAMHIIAMKLYWHKLNLADG